MTFLFLIPAIMLWSRAVTISAEHLLYTSILLGVLACGCAAFELVTLINWLKDCKYKNQCQTNQQDWEAMIREIARKNIRITNDGDNDFYHHNIHPNM